MEIKKPVTKKIAKTPMIMQLEALECGAACLTMILAYYNKWIPLEQVRKDCGVSRDGSKAKNVLIAAKSYGLNADGYKLEPEDLKTDGEFPCIIHWNFNHFVVLKGFKGNYAYINDPGRGEVKIPMSEFDESFTGIALLFEPGENFEPSGKKKSLFDNVKERIKGVGVAIAFVILTTVIANLIGVINPAFTRIFYDRLLTGRNPEWLVPFIIALSVFSLLQIIITWIQTVYNLRINGKMAAVGNATFMWKVLRLPMEFFSQRMAGDVLARKESNTAIANTIVNVFSPLFLNAIMMVFYLVVMIRYSWILAIVSVAASLINMFMSTIISKKRINATRISVRDTGKLSSTTVNGIEMIETIKSAGAEDGFFEKWSGYQASANEGISRYDRIQYSWGLVPSFVSSLSSVIILGIGIYLVMQGQLTLGGITAFNGYVASFTAPVSALIGANQQFQEMTTETERIDDVMKYPDDPVYQASDINEETFSKLSGNIELKDVTFGYSILEPPLIKDFNLKITPGKSVALVGSSGCGKSTISKLISGLAQPWSGEILFDGRKITEIDRTLFTGSLAVVDQDIVIFEDTIKNNIKMWDETIEDFEVVLAARDAQIHNDIVRIPGGYEHKLVEGGRDFSGGQRQRLEIARVLAQDPTVVILDEATSALDAKTEYDVVNAIKDRGITCIIIAHRLSTIKDCDEIIVLNKGVAVERGTHSELMKLDGYYTKLVTND